jgi:hypothetical protein
VRPPLPFPRVLYVGAAPLAAGEPFAKHFDGDAPIATTGRVTEVRMTDGQAAEFILQGQDGKLYRVLGGNPASLSAEQRAAAANLVGATLNVRGYLAYDKSCEGGCLATGRDVTLPDGSPILAPPTRR